ncbi:MAG: serine hydrolase [Clostridia bacterium]|nr:serine hydrolase [Clostridia bacterium]
MKFSSPESLGVRSEGILKFIRFVRENKINLHSFLFQKGGRIIAEGYYPPFDESFLHRLYSSTKTYVALAVGMLVTEGRIKLSDTIISFFPELDTPEVPELMRLCTVEDALMMSTPYYPAGAAEVPDIKNPYASPCHKPAGALFAYGDGNAMCTSVVERVTGMYLTDYLRPLLDKLGVGKDTVCIKDYHGGAWGGSGMLSTLRDFAKVAEFVGNKGNRHGEQLIDREYMERMTSLRTSTLSKNFYSELTTYGYGYQTWITPDAICMRGMGAQDAFYFEKSGLLFVCTGDTMTDSDVSDTRLYDAIKYFIVDDIGEPIPEGAAYTRLQTELKSLELPRYGEAHSSIESEVAGIRYTLDKNGMGWSDFVITLNGDEGEITYHNSRGEKCIRFGIGKYLKGSFPETHYYDMQRGVPSGRELDCLAIAEWLEERVLLLRVYITDTSFGSVFAKIAFKDDMAALSFAKRGEFLLDDYGGYALGRKADS